MSAKLSGRPPDNSSRLIVEIKEAINLMDEKKLTEHREAIKEI